MTKIFIIGIFIVAWLYGCQAATSQTQTTSKPEKKDSMSMDNTKPAMEQVDPGTVKIKGTLNKVLTESVTVCGRSLNNMAEARVDEVLSRGFGITNPISANDTIQIYCRYGYEFKKLESDNINLPGIKHGDSFVAQLKEKPCFNSNGSYFEMTIYLIE